MRKLGIVLAMLALLALPAGAMADHTGPLVAPTEMAFPGGDPVCPEGTEGFRFEGPGANGATQGGVTVTWVDDTVAFQAAAGVLVAQVFVKGGTNQNLYDYTGQAGGGVDHDNGLTTPAGQGVSHVDICVFEEEEEPSPTPTDEPSPTPTDEPSPTPTDEPSPTPTDEPTPTPTDEPSPTPTDEPSPALTPPPTSMTDTGSGSGTMLPVLLAGLLAAAWLLLRPMSRFSPMLRRR